MGSPHRPSVLLLELIPDNPFRHYRAETFPFIFGLCESAGVSCEWSGLGVPEDPSYEFHLGSADEAAVVALVKRHAPTHLFVNEHVAPDQWERLRSAFPGTSFLFRDRSNLAGLRDYLTDALGFDSPPQQWQGDDWLDRVTPRYLRCPANPLARELKPFVHVLAGPRCVYRQPLVDNPAYEGVDITGCHDGCAFCGRDWTPYRVGSLMDFAVRQVAGADRDLGHSVEPLRLDVHSAAVWQDIEVFVERLHDAGVRPVHIYLSPRLDELLSAAEAMDRVLPGLWRPGGTRSAFTRPGSRASRTRRTDASTRASATPRSKRPLHGSWVGAPTGPRPWTSPRRRDSARSSSRRGPPCQTCGRTCSTLPEIR